MPMTVELGWNDGILELWLIQLTQLTQLTQ